MNGAPALVHVPPGVRGTYRDEVGELMDLAGRPLDPHQLVAVEALTSYSRGGKWPTFIAGVEGPRQTVGKTGGIMLPIALALCLTFPADERTWTAHRLDTTSKTFRDARQLLGVDDAERANWTGELSMRVRNVGRENGNEHIEFANGSFLWFKARSGRAGRGLSGHDVFADELLYATDEQFGALLPTMATRSAQGSPRLWTASSSAKEESEFLRRQRQRAEARDAGIVYVGWWATGGWADPGCVTEHCMHVAGTSGCALDDRRLWREANPGLGVRTAESFLEEMRSTLDPVEFGREFLGWQQDPAKPSAVDLARWEALVDAASAPEPWPVVHAVDVSPGLRSAAVLSLGYRSDGRMHVEVSAYRHGVAWLAEFVPQMQQRTGGTVWRLGGTAPVTAVDLGKGVDVREATTSDYAAGCNALDRAVEDGTLRHLGDGVLLAALGGAARRDVGDGSFVLSRKDSALDICPAIALAIGVRALSTDQSVDVWGFSE